MKRFAAAILVAALIGSTGSAAATPARGSLVAMTPLRELDRSATAAELTETGFSADAVRFGVDTYRVEYRTIDAAHRPTTASGLLAVPRGGARALSPVVVAHGTTSYRGDAPSVQRKNFATSPALTYAAAGYAAIAPDYLGLGTGPGTHPWMDVPSETTASLDLLRAARTAVPGRALRSEVLVTGFSQGASAALGLGRALAAHEEPAFRLRALAPVSGGYAFRRAEIPALLRGELEPKSSALYSAYLLVAWNRLHHLYDTPSELFRAPYDATIESLFDGEHTGKQLMAGTPSTVDQLLTARGLELLRHPSEPFAAALRVADGVCSGWRPGAPLRMYVMPGDDQAATANTSHCAKAFRAGGVAPEVVELPKAVYGGSTHLGSNVSATADLVRWFVSRFPPG
ncbi:lipase [Amycolatopsis sp. CA-230715]|uniref:lipase n=1 Tax=Amycolatopsis sp. CA-230715 TaxID=2745196 RepID=UPI001C0399FD|nr:lipase [Amycolatopsis sp. CA-230715]QWF79537.1 hypothetical protein HUW46_02945 [Amycolatopsis sp. CA-230715]